MADNNVIQLKGNPTVSDDGKNLYVITYKSMSHDTGGGSSQKGFDYGPKMDNTPEQILKGSFSRVGDNMMWGSLYWKLYLEGTPIIFKSEIDNSTRSSFQAQIIYPTQPILTEDGTPINVDYLRKLGSFPFVSAKGINGPIRTGTDLYQMSSGQVVFVDSSPVGDGKDHLSQQIEASIKSSDSVRNLSVGSDVDGIEFLKSDEFRYKSQEGLARPDGTVDHESERAIKKIISKSQGALMEQDSAFEPGAPAKQAIDTTKSIDVKKIEQKAESVKKLDNSLKSLNDTLSKSSSKVVLAHLNRTRK